MSTKRKSFVIVYFDYLYIYLSVHTLRIANEYKLVCLVAGILTLSLSTSRKKNVCGYSNRFWLLPGHTQTDQIFTLPSSARLLDTAAERERDRERDRKRESYIFNRLIFSLREGKLNTSTLPPTHTRSFFVSFGKFFYFALAWSRKAKKWKEERRGWKEKEEKRRENVPTEFFSLPGASAGPHRVPV